MRVQTVVVANHHWKQSPEAIAEEYALNRNQVSEVLAFYKSHKLEIDEAIEREEGLETEHV